MKSYRFRSVFMFVLAVCFALITGCTSLNKGIDPLQSQVQPDDPHWVRHFKNSLGEHWYEVIYSGLRVGRAKRERSIGMRKGKPVYQVILNEEVRLQILGTTNDIKRYEEKIFSSEHPYSLLSYKYEENSEGNKLSVQIRRTGPGEFECTIAKGKRRGRQTLYGQYFTLEDELDLEMWLQVEPDIGESDSFYQLIPGMLEMVVVTATVQDITGEQVDGEEIKMYEIHTTKDDARLGHFKFAENGQLFFMSGLELSEYYLRKQKPPLPASDSVDIYTHNIVPITQTIGILDKIKSLKLTISGPSVELLETSPGQQVTCSAKGDRCQVIIGGENSRDIVLKADIAKYSEATPRIMSDHPDVVRMAKEAVGDATLINERIEKLVQYVGEYLSGEYVFNTNIIDLLKDKKGDCSEHALLFVALARSLDIPCREVSGLIYMGDWCQGFGLHGWNEVIVDGQWQGVDASHDSNVLRPIYIRFPDDPFKNILLVEATHKLSIDIEEVIEID